jgi:hypothetical protein
MIILEDGTNVTGANSYVDHEGSFYTEYLAGHSYGAVLSDATAEEQEKAIRMATRVLDVNIAWNGYAAHDDQELKWPRTNVIVEGRMTASNIVPKAVKEATVELAIHLTRRDRTDDSYEQPVEKMNLGDGALQLDLGPGSASAAPDQIIPDIVARIVRLYGRRIGVGIGQRKVSRA